MAALDRHGERETHNPLVPGSSPGGPTISHRVLIVMSLRPEDRSPLVCLMAVAWMENSEGAFDGGRDDSGIYTGALSLLGI